jgi:hypothetical protein
MFTQILKVITFGVFLSASLYADRVTMSNDGTGDFLIAPLYLAKGDICTEVKVFNTNETSSILAKVVFRERIASHEVDLPIFLSPGDVWSGKVCQQNKQVILTSSDDSNHPAALDTLMRGKNLGEHSLNSGDRNNDVARGYVEINGQSFEIKEIEKDNIDFEKGYIEVYPIAQYYEGSRKKVGKAVLVDRWDRLIDGSKANHKLSKFGIDSYSLSGVVSFQTEGQETSSIAMKAFKGAHDKLVLGDAINYSSRANADVLLGKEKKNAILKLLQYERFSLTYDNSGKSQFIHLTFPFSYKEKQSRKFKFTIRDMEENKYTMIFSPRENITDEVGYISVENLIQRTRDPKRFQKGMIQITALVNNDEVQLGKNKTASVIPTLSRISPIGGKDIMINAVYLPTKK